MTSTTTRPPIPPAKFTCKPPEENPNDTKLAQLTACKDAMICYAGLNLYNSGVTEYNNIQESNLAAANAMWSQSKKAHDDRLNAWDKKTGEYVKWGNRKTALENEDIYASCGGAGTHPKCPSGTNEITACVGCGTLSLGCKRRCRRNPAEVNKLLTQEGYDAAKPTFTTPQPTSLDFPKMEQNKTAINMNCCSNYMNLAGNDNSKNVQSCEQSITQTINNLPGETPAPPPPKETTTPPPPKETPAKATAAKATAAEMPSYVLYIIIFAIILSCIISSAVGYVVFR